MGNIKFDFTGKVLAITGAAGGIAKAIALGFADAGAAVVIGDMKEDDGQKVVDQIREKGGKAAFFKLDVTNFDNVREWVKFTIDTFGQLDFLCNGAGLSSVHKGNPFTNYDDNDFERAWRVNLLGHVHTISAVYDYMKERGYGRIINIASTVYRSTNLNYVPYATSKAAAVNLVWNMAKELGPYGVTVNHICPGFVVTPMYEGYFKNKRDQLPKEIGNSPEEMVDYFARQSCATKRRQEPEEIAWAAMYLASDEACSVNGSGIEVNGGYKL